MMTSKNKGSFENLKQGEFAGRMDIELEKAIANCLDPNYDESPRKVTATITIKPNDRRDEAYFGFKFKTENGKIILGGIAARIGRGQDGRPEFREILTTQGALFERQDNVTPIRQDMAAGITEGEV